MQFTLKSDRNGPPPTALNGIETLIAGLCAGA